MLRTSAIHEVSIDSLDSSTILQAGDTDKIKCFSAVLALQRERSDYGSLDIPFQKYEVFSRPVVTPKRPPRKTMQSVHVAPFITVGRLGIIGTGGSALIHLGSVNSMTVESKAINIRNFLTHPFQETEEET